MRHLSAGWRQITGKGREGELVLFNYLNGFPPQILLCLGVTVVTRGQSQSQLECGDAGWAVVIMTGEEERNLQPDPS